MNIELLREIIARSAALDPNDDYGQEKCWNEMTDILSGDISAAIRYFESECTDEELYWLGSVFEAVAEKTQSKGCTRNILSAKLQIGAYERMR